MTKAVYAGSFDPFTLGHLDIVEQAVPLFDEIEILFCANSNKKRFTSAVKMCDQVTEYCKIHFGSKVKVYLVSNYLVADYCKTYDVDYLIRGLRNTTDYLYEENIANINNEINPDLKTIYFRTRNEAISSSMVKELYKYGKAVDKYLPEGVTMT